MLPTSDGRSRVIRGVDPDNGVAYEIRTDISDPDPEARAAKQALRHNELRRERDYRTGEPRSDVEMFGGYLSFPMPNEGKRGRDLRHPSASVVEFEGLIPQLKRLQAESAHRERDALERVVEIFRRAMLSIEPKRGKGQSVPRWQIEALRDAHTRHPEYSIRRLARMHGVDPKTAARVLSKPIN